MKHLIKYLLSLLLLFLAAASSWAQQALQIAPAKPQRGDEIIITYHAGKAGAKIPADAKNVTMVFTYSTFYELPYRLPLKLVDGEWTASFKVPRYATYACFYLESGDIKDKPSETRQYEIVVYKDDKRVKSGYLHEAYSLSAQMGRTASLPALQKKLYEQELQNQPDNYEARVRLYASELAAASTPAEKGRILTQAHQFIKNRFDANPTVMGNLNLVTMGYLILGETSRVDSVHQVVMKKYPNSDAAKDFLSSSLAKEKDTLKRITALENAIKAGSKQSGEGRSAMHDQLFDLYAARKNAPKALLHARVLARDTSPYRARTLKNIAEVLTKNHLTPDTAIKYARAASVMAAQYPVDIIRYFPEFGYIPGYVADDVRSKQVSMVKAQLESLLAVNYQYKKQYAEALKSADAATAAADDKETLTNAAYVYEQQNKPQKAHDAAWKILLKEPNDSTTLTTAKRTYIAYNGSASGYTEKLKELEVIQQKQMQALAKRQMLNLKGPELLKIVDLKGQPLDKEKLKGKIIVMDFWATWCIPCMEELPYLQKVYDRFKNNPDVVFMVINSGAKNTLADAQNWAAKNQRYTFPLYYNGDPDIGEKVGFTVIPTLAVIDKNGKMQFRTIGFEGEVLERKLSAEIDVLLQ